MDRTNHLVLTHLDRMTDSTGLIQHAIYSVPRRGSGYTTDDNARALRLCVQLWCRHPSRGLLSRLTRYLSFIEHARSPTGRFHNLLSYRREWMDEEGPGDCQGQVVRALAEVLGSSLPDSYRTLARELIEGLLPALGDLGSLRAQAYVVLAWSCLKAANVRVVAPLESAAWFGAQRLAECYQRTARPDWQWFEASMTYANAVLPHAMFTAAACWPEEKFLEVAQATFAFLDVQTTTDGVFWPIGNLGWHGHGADRARYDQQPIEAVTMAEAALAAFRMLGEATYSSVFDRADAWFYGKNSLRQTLVDAETGACCDGLHEWGINRNQGAESTLAFLSTAFYRRDLRQVGHPDDETEAARR